MNNFTRGLISQLVIPKSTIYPVEHDLRNFWSDDDIWDTHKIPCAPKWWLPIETCRIKNRRLDLHADAQGHHVQHRQAEVQHVAHGVAALGGLHCVPERATHRDEAHQLVAEVKHQPPDTTTFGHPRNGM